jgi:hypothetical protein
VTQDEVFAKMKKIVEKFNKQRVKVNKQATIMRVYPLFEGEA